MLNTRNIYFIGTALVSLAALNEGSVTGSLVLAGAGLMLYALARAINDNI